jgi:CheY-like chemotaxis protein
MKKSFLKFLEVCMKLRILLVDESQTTRRVLSALVSSRWTVCGEAKNGKSAETQFRELKRGLVLLDLGRPDIDGPEVGRQMHAIDPSRHSHCLLCRTPGAWKVLHEAPAFAESFPNSNRGSSWTRLRRSWRSLPLQALVRKPEYIRQWQSCERRHRKMRCQKQSQHEP